MEEGRQQKYVQAGEWLNLRLGRKVFTCKFCDREFHSSQALGGHQNAHRREKTMFAHCIAASRPSLAPHPHPHPHSRGHEAGPGPMHPPHGIDYPYVLQETPGFGGSRREDRGDPADVPDLDLKL